MKPYAISPERWKRIKPLVQAALELPRPEASCYLDRTCRDDSELRDEVERVLRACRDAESTLSFLDSPAAQLAAPLLGVEDPTVESSDELGAGAEVGPYTIEHLLGRGGMGIVYLARDPRLHRSVALKVLPGWLAMSEVAKNRFIEEARAASRRDHQNIATIYEIGESADGRLYITMAYYEGETLRERLRRGPLELDEALDLASQIAEGLAAAHARGIVHRDIKPENVIVTHDGVAKILDFGAAMILDPNLAETAVPIGTAAYMSPEQSRREDVDRRTDIWSLGVVLYEMLAGRRPFPSDGTDDMLVGIRHEEPTPLDRLRPDVPEALARIVHRCLSKDAAARYGDGSRLAADLHRVRPLVSAETTDDKGETWTRVLGRSRVRIGATAGVVLAGAAAFVYLLSGNGLQGGDVSPSASTIAVLPFEPTVDDTSLARLGRDLVVTLGASLDGVPGIRATGALAILAGTREGRLEEAEGGSLEAGRELVRGLGAGSLVHGTLIRTNDDVRIEMSLIDVADGRRMARATATGPFDDIGALTDSAALAILRPVWQGRGSPVPNLGAVTTRSLPALRAYVEGEQAFARAEHREAVQAFERAFEADSTFWLAYWRSIYPRAYEGSPVDSAVLARIAAHRDRLPAPDRLMVEAEMATTLTERLETLRAVTRRFPDYWPGWYSYADELVHRGPYVGTTLDDARAGLERLIALHPDFAAGWRHLLLVTVLQRDTTGADKALKGLEQFEAPDAFVFNPDNMSFFRALHGLLRSKGRLSPVVATDLAGVAGRVSPRVPPVAITTTLLFHGFPGAQLQQIEALLEARPPRELVEAAWMSRAFAWATRGAWDSALVASDAWSRLSDDPRTELRGYGLAVTGAFLGSVAAHEAGRRRPDWTKHPNPLDENHFVELAWLDGILANVRRDPEAVAVAREELNRTGGTFVDLLDASLGAFQQQASGDVGAAGRSLAALEWESAEKELWIEAAPFHPFLSAIHRVAASRWLLEVGDTAQAARLLPWHRAVFGGHAAMGNEVAAPIALYELARLEEIRARPARAAAYYREFLERYDMPPRRHEAWTDTARAFVEERDVVASTVP